MSSDQKADQEYCDNGMIRFQKIKLINGKREGEQKTWYSFSGQLYRRVFYRNGKLEELEEWYPNGQMWAQEFYKNGELEGDRKYWSENGQLIVKEFYRNGKNEGKCRYWYGKYTGSQCFYRNGKFEGEFKEWNDEGILSWEFRKNGHMVENFDLKKKYPILKVKRSWFRKLYISSIDTFLISDLSKN